MGVLLGSVGPVAGLSLIGYMGYLRSGTPPSHLLMAQTGESSYPKDMTQQFHHGPTFCADCGGAISATAVRCRRCAAAVRRANRRMPRPEPHDGAAAAEDAARLAGMLRFNPRDIVAIPRKSAGL